MLDFIYHWLRKNYFPFGGGSGDRLHYATDNKRGIYLVWFYSADFQHRWEIEPHTTIVELSDALKGAEVIS